LFTGWTSILETLLDIAMTILFWVQFRSIGRELFNQDFRMVLQIGLGNLAAMGPGTIPNQDEFSGYLPLNVLQGFNEFFAIDRTFKMPFVDFAG